ncbi:carbamoyltransferase [Acidobacteria bacterium AH-259-D05]|nr:carbamoyltransferase [Acidobacteria bacterium AH-259-D05]
MYILGINAYHGDASAAIVADGKLVAAVEEERFTRIKHTAGFPVNAVRYCLEAAGITIREVDHIVVPRDPMARFARKLFYAARLPRFALDRVCALRRFGSIKKELAQVLDFDPDHLRARLHRVEHHLAHLASSFFVSPFERAAVLSLDGLGDFGSGMWGIGEDNRIRVLSGVTFPHSVGMCYTALTQYLGFWKFGDEYKVMGLAAYGEPEYVERFRRILLTPNGMGYRLSLGFFTHQRWGPTMTWAEGEPTLGQLFSGTLEDAFGPRRDSSDGIERRHRNLAASLQKRLEEVAFHQWNHLHAMTHIKALAYAGGVAFNCVANGQIFKMTPFEEIYIQPAAGDAGLAIGAAFYVWNHVLGQPRSFVMEHAYWGPESSDPQLRNALEHSGVLYRRLDDDPMVREAAQHIAAGKVVGWFQGRVEWGPRALGNRSILVDPRRSGMKTLLNERIKHREPFRPFAPSVLEEYTGEYFENNYPSPFMLMAYPVRANKRSVIPVPTHVDGTGRLQTVSRHANPRYWQLIDAFRQLTGVPVVVNTSFNDNEPIVCTPDEAIECFLRTRMDVLVLGNYIVEKGPQGDVE